MNLKLTNWQRIIFYNDQFNHLPLYRFAMKLQITPGYFNILVKELQNKGLIYLSDYDLRSKRIKLTNKGRVIADCLHQIEQCLKPLSND